VENLFASRRILNISESSAKRKEKRSISTSPEGKENNLKAKKPEIPVMIREMIPFTVLILSGMANRMTPAMMGKNII
jgi:hypothetical protein